MERIGVKTREFGWDQVLKSLKAACLKDFTFILRALERHCEAVDGPKREGEREMLVVGRGAGSQGWDETTRKPSCGQESWVQPQAHC